MACRMIPRRLAVVCEVGRKTHYEQRKCQNGFCAGIDVRRFGLGLGNVFHVRIRRCAQQPATVVTERLKIPAKLPTLGESVQQLNPRAIALSWQVLGGFNLNQLRVGCSAAVKRFVAKVPSEKVSQE